MQDVIGVRHVALPVKDLNESIHFYVEHLGFSVSRGIENDKSDWAMLCQSGTSISFVLDPEYDGRKIWKNLKSTHPPHFGIQVLSSKIVDEMFARLLPVLKEQDLKCGKPVLHRDQSYGFYFEDPSHNTIEYIYIPAKSLTSDFKNRAVILLAHGSYDPRWREPFITLVNSAQDQLGSNVLVKLAYMEMASPALEQIVEEILISPIFLENRLDVIDIFPVFMAEGAHLRNDVPKMVSAIRAKHSSLQLRLHSAVGEDFRVQNEIIQVIAGLLLDKRD